MLNAVVVLFYLHRGLDVSQIFYLSIVWSLTSLVFEIPTGYLADRFGRKRTMILGAFLLVLSQVGAFLAVGFPAFIVVFILMSAAWSCFSGTEEALLYDTLKELGEEKTMIAKNGRLQSAQAVFKILTPAIGAWIASGLLEWQFQVDLVIDGMAMVGAFTVYFFLTEPRHVKDVTAYEKGIFRESLETIRREPFLLRAALNKILIFIVSFLVWRVYQPVLVTHGVTVFWLGVFYVLMEFVQFNVYWHIGVIERKLGSISILFWSVILTIASLVGVLITQNPVFLFLLFLFNIIFTSIREPVFADAVHKRISSRSRATTLSNLNAIKGFLDIPILLLAGWLASYSTNYVIMICIGICALVLVCFPIRKKDLAFEAIAKEDVLAEAP
jgi:MFS family permease